MYRVVLRLFPRKRAFLGEIDFIQKMEWLVAALKKQLRQTTKTSKKPATVYSVDNSLEGVSIFLGIKDLPRVWFSGQLRGGCK